MKLLMISTDQRLFSADDLVARQKGYFKDQDVTILILMNAVERETTIEGMRLVPTGGSNKITSFLRGLWFVINDDTDYRFVTTQDVLFTGILGSIVSKRKRIPFFVQLHGDYLDNPLWLGQRKINHILNMIGKRLLKRANAVRVVSARIKKDIVSRYGIEMDRVISLPICTDLEIFSPTGPSQESKKYLFFVGRLIDEKDPMMFCRVAARVMKEKHDIKTVIAGEGALEGAMREVFNKQHLMDRVTFLGNCSAETVSYWYRSSICLLHTAPWEGWGMPMIEAIACGCPVVTTDTGCANEAIHHEQEGLVYPVGDEEGFYQGVKTLCVDQQYRNTLSALGMVEAKKWSYDARKGDLMNFYQRFL